MFVSIYQRVSRGYLFPPNCEDFAVNQRDHLGHIGHKYCKRDLYFPGIIASGPFVTVGLYIISKAIGAWVTFALNVLFCIILPIIFFANISHYNFKIILYCCTHNYTSTWQIDATDIGTILCILFFTLHIRI